MALQRCTHLTAALRTLDSVAPLALAAKWDNTGLILDATASFNGGGAYKVFLTNDLTPAVLSEALDWQCNLIVAYHPPVFGALKRFTIGGGHSASVVLQCARAAVAVYSPHTALDSVKGGINDWLLDELFKRLSLSEPPSVKPIKDTDVPAFIGSGAGDGRVAQLSAASNVSAIVAGLKAALSLESVQVALPWDRLTASRGGREAVMEAAASVPITSIAVCAGSGASVLSGVTHAPGLLLLTGEMGHHEVLAANAAGATVVLTNHSNCERGYLAVLRGKLLEAWAQQGKPGTGSDMDVRISQLDADPLVAC